MPGWPRISASRKLALFFLKLMPPVFKTVANKRVCCLGEIPVVWETGDIVPLFKEWDRQWVEKGRPKTLFCRSWKLVDCFLYQTIRKTGTRNRLRSKQFPVSMRSMSTVKRRMMYISDIIETLKPKHFFLLFIRFPTRKWCQEKKFMTK